MSSCVWHRPVVGCVYELSVKWHNGVWVFDNMFVGYPDGDPQSLRLACSRGDSGMGCCTAPLEGTPATNPSLQEVRVGDAGKAISFLEGCCRSRRKCWARGRSCLGAVGVPRMCPFPTVPEIRGVMNSWLHGVGFTAFQVLSPNLHCL